MAGRVTRLRGSTTEESANQIEDDDETQAPDGEEQNESANQISDAHGNPSSNELLTPQGLWFDANAVVQVVTDGIQSYYDKPYTCWTNSSDHAKIQWWRYIRDNFKWSPQHSSAVKVGYQKKAQQRIKDMANKASKVAQNKRIPWMSTDLRKKFLAVRSTDEFKARSVKCGKNRIVGPKSLTRHCQGSVSSMQIAKKMMKHTYCVSSLS